MTIIVFIAGLLLLVFGAEMLVRGASRLAGVMGISPLIIGLTVVAFGTSTPELAVSLNAVSSGQSDIALGNIIGSNVANILLILGVTAIITPLVVSRQLFRLDVPVMIGASVLVLILGLDGTFGRIDGFILFSGIILYTGFLIYKSLNDKQDPDDEYIPERKVYQSPVQGAIRNIPLIVIGLVLLVIGSGWLVDSAEKIALYLGVSELIIGLTITAIGTSTPELVTSVVDGFRNERDIAVGNIVGSNIFNILVVLGLTSLLSTGIDVPPSVIRFDLPVMIAVAFACLPVFFTGGIISRWEGGLFFGYYIAYTLFLVLTATGHESLPVFSAAMLYFVIPLTMITLLVLMAQAMRRRS